MNRIPRPPRAQAVSPKLNVIRGVSAKLAPVFRRYFSEIGRVQANPGALETFTTDAENAIVAVIKAELGKGNMPILNQTDSWKLAPKKVVIAAVLPTEEAPEGVPETTEERQISSFWVYEALAGRRNFMHGRAPVGCVMGYVKVGEDGVCSVTHAGVYFPIDDVMVVAETGMNASHTGGPNGGATAMGRLRVAGRRELKDAMLLLPWSSADSARLKLMDIAGAHTLHTRKSGHALNDVIEVAGGRADIAILTRLTPLELQVASLFMAESGGVITDLKGNAITPATTEAIVSNAHLGPLVVKMLG